MRFACKLLTLFFSTLIICSHPCFLYAKFKYEVTPGISIGELFDDNIDLNKVNKKSDWVTTISPSVLVNLVSEKSNLLFNYSPTIVRYNLEKQNNTVRRSGSITFNKEFTQRVRFDLSDTYLKSEESIERTAGIYEVRHTRDVYQRNAGDVSMTYLLGQEDNFKLGYNYALLNNRDVTLNDNMVSYSYAELNYWFNIKNEIGLDYRYTVAKFMMGDSSLAEDDFTGNKMGIRYVHRFNTNTTTSLVYNLTTRDFNGVTQDYNIYEGTLETTHLFLNNVSLSISGGYYRLETDTSPVDNYSCNVSIIKSFNRENRNISSISISGSRGWREGYQEVQRRGFISYWGTTSTFNYNFTERLNNYVSINYMSDKSADTDLTIKNFTSNYGWRWSFTRNCSLSVDYSFARRNSSLDNLNYNLNTIGIIFTWSKMYKK
jgi:hypothetical protein